MPEIGWLLLCDVLVLAAIAFTSNIQTAMFMLAIQVAYFVGRMLPNP